MLRVRRYVQGVCICLCGRKSRYMHHCSTTRRSLLRHLQAQISFAGISPPYKQRDPTRCREPAHTATACLGGGCQLRRQNLGGTPPGKAQTDALLFAFPREQLIDQNPSTHVFLIVHFLSTTSAENVAISSFPLCKTLQGKTERSLSQKTQPLRHLSNMTGSEAVLAIARNLFRFSGRTGGEPPPPDPAHPSPAEPATKAPAPEAEEELL